MTFKIFIIIFLLATAIIMPLPAFAESNYRPSFYVPWLANQGYSHEAAAEPAAENPPAQGAVKRQTAPAKAVLTPAQTQALKERLEEADGDIDAVLPSPLEQAYAARIIEPLTQFGYDMFAVSAERPDTGRAGLPSAAVQDDFILNSGDRLKITFRGQRNNAGLYDIDSEGLLVVEDLAPVPAAGRTIGQVTEELQDLAVRLHNTDVFVSLDKVRQIDVLVVGNVKKPGRKTLTVFDTVLDALNESGGIEKTGSLRRIKLVRHGRSTIIDLYALLIHGSTNMDLALQDGDKLMIPPIGPSVAIAGGVKRPGVYEITPLLKGSLHEPDRTSRKISLEDMLELGGGVLSPGQNRFLKLGLTRDGTETVTEIDEAYDALFGDGSILMVAPSIEARGGTVELAGETRRPGMFDLDTVPTLAALLDDKKVFGADIYPLIGVIERWDEDQMAAKLIDFPPLLVAKGKFDRKLQEGDVVHLFSRAQILTLQNEDEQAEIESGSALIADDVIADPVLRSFLKERSAFVRGAVRQEGSYPLAAGTSLENIVAVAGGLALEASTKNIEVTSAFGGEGGQAHGRSGTQRRYIDYTQEDPAAVILEPGDTVRVNQKFRKVADNAVQIIGEVAHPGAYDLMPGDTLSALLRRAGGLTKQAYPDGTIFSRESERRAEESRFRMAARDLERSLATAMQDEDKAPDSGQIAMARDLAAELRQVEAVGRITVEADPGVLVTQPELDMLLEPGDRIYIPKRPLSVRVNGEVLSPAVLQFRKDKDPRDYIDQAGGFTFNADKDRTFVLYPDGSAQPLQVNVWNHTATFIPPGSTIIVPRDPKPFDFIESARDISQILSNLAITGIFLDDLRKN